MSDYKTDDEKVEELKAWWKENGTSVIAGVVLAIGGILGWQYWQDYQNSTAEAASALYAKVDKAAATDIAQAQSDIQALQQQYKSTPYAAIASLKAAQQYAAKGDYASARVALQWVLENSKDTDFQHLAKLRLARVLLAMQEADEALTLVNQPYPAAYLSLVEELKGDIFVAQNKITEARSAYDKALLSSQHGSTELIKMKRDNLGDG
ncbi:MAG: YfgM family protein [Thiothrix sp.]